MDRKYEAVHYHVRWSLIKTLDWEWFGTRDEAEASAKGLVRAGETYTIEEQRQDCQRCQQVMKVKSAPGISKGAAA